MSDGPHRSLPMRKGWKAVAERADKSAYEPKEICEALAPALAEDWQIEVPSALIEAARKLFPNETQGTLLPPTIEEIEGLRPMVAGAALGELFLSHLAMAADEGMTGQQALQSSAEAALGERALQGARQIEEHYDRDSGVLRASKVRGRTEEGIASADLGGLAERLLQGGPRRELRQIPKHSDIDDGVPMP